MFMVLGDKFNFCSCFWISGILVVLEFCEVDVVFWVFWVVGGGVWLDGGLLVVLCIFVWFGEIKFVLVSWV